MPSLLSRVALTALAGSGGHPRRRLVQDASLTPCTHDICGRRTLALPTYHAGSLLPNTNLKRCDADGQATTCNNEATGFAASDGYLMKLDISQAHRGSGGEGSITRSGNDIVVSVTMGSGWNQYDQCHLGVDIAQDKPNSDATLQFNANKYVNGNALTADYTGNTTLAVPAETTDVKFRTMSVTVNPSSFPYRYEDNNGAKLHTGRLGITLSPYIRCDGAQAGTLEDVAVYLPDFHAQAKGTDSQTAHPFFYDLKADGASLTSQDQAETTIGDLDDSGIDAKRAYKYSAPFVHFHDQVRFPNASIAGKSHDNHFESPDDPGDAKCSWNHGAFVNDIDQTTLIANGWMSANDSITPTQAYGAWTPDLCDAGICKKYRKDATVASETAYLPFDKPLLSYYDTLPKVECVSQHGTVEGIAKSSEIVPDISNDNAPAIFSGVKTKFTQPVNIGCAGSRDGSVNGVDNTICDTDDDNMIIKGQIFSFDAVTTDFTNLLTDEYDFSATYSCDQERADGTPAETCSITPGADSAVTKLTALKRVDDNNDNLQVQLEAKANAVEALTFDVPAKYGTTFKTFEITLSSRSKVTGAHKYRATGAFEITMLLSDSDQITAGDESIQWTGGPAAKATKDFEGFGTTDRFTARTANIKTETRVKASAIAGYFTPNAVFVDNGNGTGIMSPFNDVGDLAVSGDATEKDNLEGTNDAFAPTDPEMGPENKFYAVKSFCCGRDDERNDIDCKKSRAGGDAVTGLAADDAAASAYCRTNGFEAVRCLSSELDVEYTVTTLSKDARFPPDTKVATKTYTEDASASLTLAEQGFDVNNTEYEAVTVGAGERAGETTFDYTVDTTHMGTAKTQFARQAYTTSSDVETYNCESVGRTIVYSVDIATPCGESELDTPTMSKYALTADLEAHYVYTDGNDGTPDQVSQKVETGTIGNKDNGAEAYQTLQNWLTTEWRVQDSSDPGSAAKGSGTPIELKVIIANDYPSGADAQAQGLHMPSSKVFIVNDDTLNVTSGPGSVELKADSCVTTAGGETSCVLLYTNDEVMSIDDGKLCGDLGTDNAVGGTNGAADQPACPVIEYTIAARVKNGGVTNAFGADGACGEEAQGAEVALTKIGGVRSHTLYVLGNKRAYDGVLDIHAIERDTQCAAYCTAAEEAANCYEDTYTSLNNSEFLKPEVSDGSTYCRNPFRLASETLHDVAVPGKDGAARTILDRVTEGEVSTSKDLTFEVRFLRIGYGPRRFTIDGLTENVPANLPKPWICSSGQYADADGEGCVRSDRTADLGAVDTVIPDQKICPNGGDDCTDDEKIDNIGKFYIALGKDKTADVCSNSNVGDDPYTVDVNGVPTMTLGFSIKVEYFTEAAVGTGHGDPDTGVVHKFYFKLACPKKDYSMNFVRADGDASAQRANIPADTNMGLIGKGVYGESHYKYLKMFSYFSGRSTDAYSSNGVQHKAMVRLEDNPSVKFRSTSAQPVTMFNEQGAIFLDTADTFESRQTIEFEFKNPDIPCLFTTIKLISKASPYAAGSSDIITDNSEDKSFSFRVQCPRWSGETATDALVLRYDVKETTFGGSGGSVTTEIQPLTTTGQINAFNSIRTSLRGCLCGACPDESTPTTACLFPTTDTDGNALGAGAESKLEKDASQQQWLEYLKTSCGFSVSSGGNFVGYMERQYIRPDLGLRNNQQESQTYCSGRKLSFGIQTQGTHTARLRVESPLQMDFAVQIDKLEWSQDGCDSNLNQYKLVAEATVYRKASDVDAWVPAASSTFTDIVATSGFIPDPIISEHRPQAGSIKIEGVCQALVFDHRNCGVFEAERQLDFGALYSKFGVDYRANLGIDLTMTCPKGVEQKNDSGGVALRHSTECADYDDPNDAFDTCQTTETDNAGETVAIVGANGQVRLTLIIDDTAYTSHTVLPPTYKITPTGGGDATEGSVASLCSVYETDCMYRAKDASGDYIDLVTQRAYPTDPVSINGVTYDWSNRENEENSVVTLRALPLSGSTVEITWVVNRVVDGRRLRVTYSLGAAASNGADSVGFKVLPATREEDAGIAVGAGTEEVAEGAHTTERSGTSHAEEEKGDTSTSTVYIPVIVIFGVVAIAGLLVVTVCKKKKGEGESIDSESSSGGRGPGSGVMKSRFYQYARLDKGEDHHVESLWKRNRFNTGNSRFL